ncbi:MAG: hypothetical protein IRZ33_10095 [Alicyclobacillaceae bacterium]|nr:hypothetical protein [Alicyclobacillaceae bacterium]
MNVENEQDRTTPQPENAAEDNPIAAFERVWKIAEKVTLSLSLALVIGTIGYLSVWALA